MKEHEIKILELLCPNQVVCFMFTMFLPSEVITCIFKFGIISLDRLTGKHEGYLLSTNFLNPLHTCAYWFIKCPFMRVDMHFLQNVQL